MEIRTGDKVKYFFPEPADKEKTSITGVVESVADSHLFLKTEDMIRLKISFKNFHLIYYAESDENKNTGMGEIN